MYSLEFPYLLLLVFVFILSEYLFKEKTSTFYFPHLNILKKVSYNHILLNILKYSSIVLLLLALSSPIKKLDTKIIKNDGIDIVLDLDTSGSMRAVGFNRNNLEENRWLAVSNIVKDFIKQRVNDNIALVVFGSSVMTASPISFDKEAQIEILSYLDIAIVGEQTAMIDSLASSIKILKDSKNKSKIIVLLTDGEDTASQIPLSVVIKLAKKYSIKIYTISIGNRKIRVLNEISSQTNGKSYRAINSESLKNIYKDINLLEKSKINKNKITLKEYYFFYPLLLSIILLITYIYLKNRD